MKILLEMYFWTRNSPLNFGLGILQLWHRGSSAYSADNSRCCQQIIMIFLRDGCFTSNKQFFFGAVPDRERDPGIFATVR